MDTPIIYTLTNDPNWVKRGDTWIPTTDPKNIDFQVYQAWAALGNIPAPANG